MAFSSTIWRLSASSYSIASSLCSLFKCRCSRISFSNSISATTSLGNLLSSNKFLRLVATKPLLSVQAVAAASKVATLKTLPKSRPWKPRVIKRPPLDDARFAEKLLSSPQLSLKSLPLLSSCLPSAPLSKQDKAWIEDNLLEAKDALGLASMEAEEGTPGAHLDTLLFLAFQHQESQRAKRSPYVRKAHSRLAFLGQFLLELAFAELFLQMFPRETTACLRERVLGLTHKKVLPSMIKAASMDRLVYPGEDLELLKRDVREPACRSVFWALTGAIYLTLGMPEVYRVLFEVFGMDIDGKSCQPQLRNIQDLDLLSPELDGRRLSWQEICFYQVSIPPSKNRKGLLFMVCGDGFGALLIAMSLQCPPTS
jgi:dsRNA-specific ribonuclease